MDSAPKKPTFSFLIFRAASCRILTCIINLFFFYYPPTTTMKFLVPLALSASIALAAVIPQEPLGPSIVQNTQEPKWLIELSPYTTRWVTEEEKWALKLVGHTQNELDASIRGR